MKRGKIRVGRCIYKNGKRIDPSYQGFVPIVVMTKSSKYGSLGPYVLKNDKGQNMENLWQFSKVYMNVPKSTQKYSRYDRTVIWDHPAEQHVDIIDGKYVIRSEYINWRNKGINSIYAIRYPVGYKHRHKCLFSLKSDKKGIIDPIPLNYIESRKQIYLPLYVDMVKSQKQFKTLVDMLKNGTNILIIEVDGPHQESLQYYIDKYKVGSDFIDDNSLLATKDNLNIMLNDEKHPFGHGFCLSIALNNHNN